jgi:hypothetical protein
MTTALAAARDDMAGAELAVDHPEFDGDRVTWLSS